MAQEERPLLNTAQISKHNTPSDCWIVVDNQVWDMTDFAPDHPGGGDIIYKHAGRDATASYNNIHAPSLLPTNLPPSAFKGTLDRSTIDDSWSAKLKPEPETNPTLVVDKRKPALHTLLSLHDFEIVASQTLSAKTWAFYSSAATDLITRDANRSMFDRIWFRPRMLRNVRDVDTRTKVLGVRCQMPVFVSPAALARLVHPDGEKGIARACREKGVIQCVSTNASYPIEEILASSPSHPFFFQLYVNKDRPKTEALLAQLRSIDRIAAIFVTVDAPVAGKREADERVRADESVSTPMSGAKAGNDKRGGGLGRIMGSYIDATLNWDDLAWLRRHWDGPIVIKGIQGAADAKRAMLEGVQGVVLSNHGGRSLDTSPPAILILLELQRCCPEVFESMEVYVDGGVRRGTDVLKALCLGATAVGIGRSFLYALNYGVEGVEHVIDLLKDELETSMRMIGITDLSQVHPGLVNTLDVDPLVPTTMEHPYAKWRPKPRL